MCCYDPSEPNSGRGLGRNKYFPSLEEHHRHGYKNKSSLVGFREKDYGLGQNNYFLKVRGPCRHGYNNKHVVELIKWTSIKD